MELSFRGANGPDDAAALIAVHDACAVADGLHPDCRQEYRPNLAWYQDELAKSPPEDWVIAEVAGEVVGYGHALWNWHEGDGTQVLLHLGWVKPKWRGQGVGMELLARLEARCRQKADPNAMRHEFGANASETETDARDFLLTNGYDIGFTFCEMARSLTEDEAIFEPPLPNGYDFRPILPEHYRAIWQNIGDAYDVSRPGGRFAQIATEESFHNYFHGDNAKDTALWFVVWRDSRVAGQCLCRLENDGVGTVYEMSVGFAHRRKSLASALLARAFNALRERGASVVRLGTIYENPTQAWRLYEKMGMHFVKKFPRWRKPMT